MRYRTLADFLRARMAELHTDTVQIERDYPDVPADWIRGLLLGRGTKQPTPLFRKRLKRLAFALKVDETELWRFLGRYDQVAALRGEPTPGAAPEWAVRLEAKIDALIAIETKVDALSDLLRSVGNRVDGSALGVSEILAALSKANGPQPGQTQVAPPAPRRPARRRRAPRRTSDTGQ